MEGPSKIKKETTEEITALKQRIQELEQCETTRKQTEEALRISQLRLSDAMELAHIVYWEYDPAAQTYIFNDPFYTFYGTTALQEGGYRMTMEEYAKRFIHPDDLHIFYKVVEENAPRKEPEFIILAKHRIIRRDGDVRHILVRTMVINDHSGSLVRLYGANQDIIEQKLAEEERERLILELREALSQVKALSGLLPICSSCKKIRDEQGNWEVMEIYIGDHSEAEFSHGLCPECAERLYPKYYKKEK
ncbi:MAG: PAS domain-containing protein [Spirochaetota bacterium]